MLNWLFRYLEDENGGVYALSENAGTTDESIVHRLPVVTYHIVVDVQEVGQNSYTLGYTVPDADPNQQASQDADLVTMTRIDWGIPAALAQEETDIWSVTLTVGQSENSHGFIGGVGTLPDTTSRVGERGIHREFALGNQSQGVEEGQPLPGSVGQPER